MRQAGPSPPFLPECTTVRKLQCRDRVAGVYASALSFMSLATPAIAVIVKTTQSQVQYRLSSIRTYPYMHAEFYGA